MEWARQSRVTVAIAVVTALAFFASLMAGPHILLQAGFIPLRARVEVPLYGLPFGLVPFFLTPLTATLLHGGWLHLGFNLLMLVYCGRQVETALGGLRLALLYVVGAYVAALAQLLIDPASPTPMIGASGAISAVLGTYAMLFGRGRVKAFGPVPGTVVRAVWLAVAWTVLQWGIGIAAGPGPFSIATAAHIGGFVAGLVLTWPLLEWRYRYG